MKTTLPIFISIQTYPSLSSFILGTFSPQCYIGEGCFVKWCAGGCNDCPARVITSLSKDSDFRFIINYWYFQWFWIYLFEICRYVSIGPTLQAMLSVGRWMLFIYYYCNDSITFYLLFTLWRITVKSVIKFDYRPTCSDLRNFEK